MLEYSVFSLSTYCGGEGNPDRRLTCLPFRTGKAADVGGPVSEISGSARPPLQHHTTQSQEVTCFISSSVWCYFQHLLLVRGGERAWRCQIVRDSLVQLRNIYVG